MVYNYKETNKLPKYTRRNISQWLKYLNISYTDKFEKFCLCGCGKEIIPKSYHFSNKDRKRKIRYIHGHNTKGKKMIYSKEGLENKKKSYKKLKQWHKNNQEESKKMRENNWNKTVRIWKGEKHPLWLGGKSFEIYGFGFNEDLKEIIRQRDDYICQICFKKQEKTSLCVHHIDYDKKNNCEYNLISLCSNCHPKTNFNRKKWMLSLQYLIILKYMQIYNVERGLLC